MALELGVVQLLEGVLHVLPPHVLHHAGAVLEDVRVADVPGVPHVVLQVLPAACRRETRHHHSVLAPPGRRGAASSRPSSPEAPPASLRELHTQTVAVIVVTIPGIDRVLRVPEQTSVVPLPRKNLEDRPVILKLYKGEGRAAFVLEVDKDDLAVLVEEILDVSGSDVWRKVPDVYSAV